MKRVILLCGLLLSALVSAQTVTIDLAGYAALKYNTVTRVKVGDTFEVILAENPSTGYIWEIFGSELKKGGLDGIVRPRSHRYDSDENTRGATGMGGVRIFTLEVVHEG